jgi:hypothetical protein
VELPDIPPGSRLEYLPALRENDIIYKEMDK